MRLNDNNTFIGINPPYQLSVIHSSKLIYPREIYQRGVERKRVELIARDFNEYIVNEPKVSFRNGRYYVMDGQHTIEGCILLNGGEDRPILCKVYTAANFSKIPAVSLGSNSIEIKNFLFSYGKMEAMNIPQLSVPQGAIVGILGDNGAGKTTFAKCLCGLEKSAQGFLRVGNDSLNAKQRLQKCYMVMQDVNHQLFTESVEDEILLSLPGENENADKQQAGEILENLNLLQFGKLHPMSLSGGQKQRVAIGSAIASDKEVLVFDEPTSGLDYHHMIEVARNLIALSKMGKTLFIITHDPELIAQCCNYFMFIEHGKIKWSGGWTDDNRHRLNDFFSVKL